MKIVVYIFSFCFVIGVFSQKKIKYDYSCIEEDESSSAFNLGSDFESQMLNQFGELVSLDEEIKLGEETKNKIKKQYKLIEVGEHFKTLNKVLWKLKNQIVNPKSYPYRIYLIESKELNSFTVGGKIFFTTGMYNFCKSEDEIACIIGHEIGHNELGHIRDNISRIKTLQQFGTPGQISAGIGQILITPFNQKNEVSCDFFGLDLAYEAGYIPCQNIQLWTRMKQFDGRKSEIDKFFRSHPYSSSRANCSRNHLLMNYKINCKN